VLGISHVNVEYRENKGSLFLRQKRMDFLFVRWFRRDNAPAGWAAKRLQRLEFFDSDSPASDAFGFLDPDSVVRGVHLIPAFAFGPAGELDLDEADVQDSDWRFYYLNMYVIFQPYSCINFRMLQVHGSRHVYEVSGGWNWSQGHTRLG